MRLHQNRRRLLISLATGLPAHLRKPRNTDPARRPTRLLVGAGGFILCQSGHDYFPRVCTLVYDARSPIPPSPSTVTLVYDPARPPQPLATTTHCYDLSRLLGPGLGNVVTFTYDGTGKGSRPSGEGG